MTCLSIYFDSQDKSFAYFSLCPYYVALTIVIAYFIYMVPGIFGKSPSVQNDYRVRPNEKKLTSCFRVVLIGLYLAFMLIYPVICAFTIANHPEKSQASPSDDSPTALYVPWLCLFGLHLIMMCPSMFFCTCNSTIESVFLALMIAGFSLDMVKFTNTGF